ncbi:TrmH family RNA methyltransferase [candidate division WOR-3 bacterium]|nr:TrmH family RNA methyltransferase [candidate division WOR-3 bacterium]
MKKMNFRLKRYHKDFEHSYAFGVTSTLELLEARPNNVLRIVLASRSERNAGAATIRKKCAQKQIPLVTDDKAIARLSPRENHLAIGVFKKYRSKLDPDKNHVVLVNPSDMGNLGSIARTMVGFGITDLALIRPATDIFDPRAVRASIGAIFRLSFIYFPSFDVYRAEFTHNLYPFMTDGQARIESVRFREPFALIFGNEQGGLSGEFLNIGKSVAVRHLGTIDSLNLTAAVAIALYETTRVKP